VVCGSSISHLLAHPALTPALALSVDNASREALVSALLSDIRSCKPGSTSGRLHHTGTYRQLVSRTVVTPKLSFADAHLALSTIKALGRHPSGSSVIALDSNLSTLLASSKSFKDSNLDASLEALRCIANALLLVESARATIISDSVNGGEYAVLLLEVRCRVYGIFACLLIYATSEIIITRYRLYRFAHSLSLHSVICNRRVVHRLYR
jgi:hypothetical protein